MAFAATIDGFCCYHRTSADKATLVLICTATLRTTLFNLLLPPQGRYPLLAISMDSTWFNQWQQERADSDDETNELLSVLLLQIFDEAEDLEKMMDVLNRTHGGSRPGRSPNILRDHASGHQRIWQDYFDRFCAYPGHMFRRRFRMRKSLFMKIHNEILLHDTYFVQRPDACNRPGISSIQKMTAALRIICYGSAGDSVDEYVRIGESTAISAFKHFVDSLVNLFGEEYLRHPTEEDVKKHLEINRQRGFVGMFGSLDCTHWVWKNCHVGHQGQFRDKDKQNSIILEAIATYDLWIWHAFAGMPGSNNDINVIDRSPLLVNLLNGVAPDVRYSVNGHEYDMFYLLADGIYPDYTLFMKTIQDPIGAKQKWFAKRQEAARKDVERCFGVLQARFHMLRNPSRWWSRDQMQLIWKAAVILHNMIVEDEFDVPELSQDYMFEPAEVAWEHRPRAPLSFDSLSTSVGRINNSDRARQLKQDLVEHLWQHRGDQVDDE